MRVLFLTHRLPYAPNRGDRIRAYHLLHALSRNADVHLVSLVHDDEEESHAAELENVAAAVTTARVPRVRNLARGLARLGSSTPLTHMLLDAPDLHASLRTLVASHPPDAVLAFGSGMARFALEDPLRAFPLVLDMVDVDSAKWAALAGAARPPMSWVYRREVRCLSVFEELVAERATATLVTTERERETLAALAPRARIHVVPNGVALDTFRRPPDNSVRDGAAGGVTTRHEAGEAPLVVFCGVMNYAPNRQAALWLAQDIWPLVKARRPDAKLALVGANPEAAIRRLPSVDASIEVTGGIPDVRPHLWRAAVSVAPLTIARGVPNKVLEALAAGLPCIVTPVVRDGLPTEAQRGCRTAEDAEGFAQAIGEILAMTPADRHALAAAADLRGLSWERQLRPAIELLSAAAARGRA